MQVYIMWANNGRFMRLYDLLGFGGKRVQLLQWMISLISDSSWDTGAGTIPRPGIKGLSGVIPAIIPRLGSKSESKKRSDLFLQIQHFKITTHTINLAYFNSHVRVYSLFLQCQWHATYPRKITQPFMNKSSRKQHAYFKKFTGVSHSVSLLLLG